MSSGMTRRNELSASETLRYFSCVGTRKIETTPVKFSFQLIHIQNIFVYTFKAMIENANRWSLERLKVDEKESYFY
jgi:hypothetical protein